jgi:hypothetical protein
MRPRLKIFYHLLDNLLIITCIKHSRHVIALQNVLNSCTAAQLPLQRRQRVSTCRRGGHSLQGLQPVRQEASPGGCCLHALVRSGLPGRRTDILIESCAKPLRRSARVHNI